MNERAFEASPANGTIVPLVGRMSEIRQLASALLLRQTRLVTGPPGAGKKRLVDESLSRSGRRFVRIEGTLVLHDLLVRMAGQLGCSSARFPDLRQSTSIHLKPLVLSALRDSPRCVVWKDASHADPRLYRFLQEVYYIPGCSLVVTAESRNSIGCLRKLLWDPREELAVEPLTLRESLRLFEYACHLFHLGSLELDDFRKRAIAAARGNPGQIIAMCRIAGRAEYQNGKHIKFAPVRIDALSAFV